ncbi:hypothetical protein [Deinococcus arenicola]|uniref:NUDIX hydrolase n=1 Tax=Deinococcus arenicola TaxID=2994950 RepID=A0ABU4DLR0_9DEIO|nr:hypothetical protein [Deinococcus sp. ZS9-10]MDV6373373.1 hypothetical protein [Deinococcus sp. ZS9-10]
MPASQPQTTTAYQVGVFALVRQRDVYLIVRPRVSSLPGGAYALPGLVLDAPSGGNVVESHLRRALLSQVGIAVAELRLVGSHAGRGVASGSGDARLNLIFGSDYCSGILTPQEGEILNAEWMDNAQLFRAGVPDYLLAAVREFETTIVPASAPTPAGRLGKLFGRQK